MPLPSQLEIRDHLIRALEADLIGPMNPERSDEVLPQRPSRWYLTGFLVPRGAPSVQASDPLADEALSSGLESGRDDDLGDAPSVKAQPFFPSSIGLSVIVPPEVSQLEVWATWGEYRVLSATEANALAAQYTPDEANLEPEDDEDAVEGAEVEGETRRRRRFSWWQRSPRQSQALQLELKDRAWKLTGGEDLQVVMRCRPASGGGLPEGARVVSVFLVNNKEPIKGRLADSRSLFQVALHLRCAQGFLNRGDSRGAGSSDPDEARNDLQFRKHGEWAVGHGVAALVDDPDSAGRVTHVASTWLPQARVYRMQEVSVPEVPLEMEALAALPHATALGMALQPLFQAYQTWISVRRSELQSLSASRRETAEALLQGAERALHRMRRGLARLEQDPLAFDAFQLTQQAMAWSARKARPDQYSDAERPRWRVFQLAFLLLNLEGLIDPSSPERETVELLFFPTGGGKTEAYFGVAAFAMLLRRLRHRAERHEGAGVAVLLRYTLRLLTLDQLGRAATLTCALERLRSLEPERLGTRRFAVGLWVGERATANTLEAAQKQTREYRMHPDDPRKAPPIPLVGCPWCGEPFGPDSYHIELNRGKAAALRVGCTRLGCEFSFDETEQKGLPLVVVDEQVYRELPTFLIGTVDKFALLPWRGEAGMLFGKVRACDDTGFYGHHAGGGLTKLPKGLLPPELIIQDELHLITGPLGTMVGLYETAVEQLASSSGIRPKIVASTATARRAHEQIQALYARELVEFFPPQGPDAGDTFFAKTDFAPSKSRLYVGVAAPGRSLKAVVVRSYSALLSAAYHEWYRCAQMVPRGSVNPADTYMTLAGYFNTLRELGGSQRLVLEEVAPRCFNLDRRHPIQDSESRYFRSRRLSYDVLELTSRQSTDEIRKAKGRLEVPYSSEKGERNDVLLASSMISVGVDISRLGLMVVTGQPRTVAEYIQASSRVGRSTPGLVVTLHHVFRPRDRSHFERFTAFHEGFYRWVEAASVTPFSARAMDRGLAGVTVALARYADPSLTPPQGAERVDKVAGLAERVAGILRDRVARHGSDVPEALADHVENRVQSLMNDWSASAANLAGASVHLPYSRWESLGAPVTLLSTALDPPNEKEPRLDHFRAPTSMRNVEPAVHLWVNNRLGGEDS